MGFKLAAHQVITRQGFDESGQRTHRELLVRGKVGIQRMSDLVEIVAAAFELGQQSGVERRGNTGCNDPHLALAHQLLRQS